MIKVAVGHLADLGRQPVQRPDRDGPQAQREDEDDDRQADRDRDEYGVEQ